MTASSAGPNKFRSAMLTTPKAQSTFIEANSLASAVQVEQKKRTGTILMMDQITEKKYEDYSFTITDLSKDFGGEQVKKIKEIMADGKGDVTTI